MIVVIPYKLLLRRSTGTSQLRDGGDFDPAGNTGTSRAAAFFVRKRQQWHSNGAACFEDS
ncbi:MAG: hypothetical protein KME08_13905 [Aphanothece sp. CMT-3BRIN-NPC111]|nr:hypothetical protein [Aphanothece sp. CMT-3BRIN-NPC111]